MLWRRKRRQNGWASDSGGASSLPDGRLSPRRCPSRHQSKRIAGQPGIGNVGQQLEGHHRQRDQQQDTHHRREVGALQVIDEQPPHPRPGEDALDQCPGQQEGQIQADHCDDGSEAFFQRMDHHHHASGPLALAVRM
jgi:hypothetical protein